MERFLSTVIIIVIFFYGLRFLFRLLFPIIMKRVFRNMQQREEDGRSEGDYTIYQDKKEERKKPKLDGEYVDFEEIKE